MSETLMEIMKPIIEPVLRQDRQVMVNVFREHGLSDEEIKTIIMKNFGLTPEDAEQYL